MSNEFATFRFLWSCDIAGSVAQNYRVVVARHLAEICKDQLRLTGKEAFVSSGIFYQAPPFRVVPLNDRPYGEPYATLHTSLEGRFSEWQHSYAIYTRDAQKLGQGLKTLLGKAQCDQDLRDMLPELCYRNLAPTHPIQLLTRTRPDLYAAQLDGKPQVWDPKLVSNYRAIASLVDTFNGYSLL